MPYKTFTSGAVLTAADLNAISADAVQTDISTSETTTSLTFTDLATVGPTASLSVVNGQQVLVIIACRLVGSAGSVGPVAGFACSGALTLPAASISGVENDSLTGVTCSRSTIVVASSTATLTATMKYKVTNAGTGTFLERRIILKKF